MAAVKSALLPSPSTGLMSAFSPYSNSPTSPSRYNKRSSGDSTGHLQPQPQKSPQLQSPSDAGGPSPIVSSNGTDTTEFDDTGVDDQVVSPHIIQIPDGEDLQRADIKLETKDADGNDFRPPSSDEEYPSSVIHAPKGFDGFISHTEQSPPAFGRSTPTPSQRSDITVISPHEDENGKSNGPASPPPITTTIPRMTEQFQTPRAQTRQEAEAPEHERASRVKSTSLEDIPETQDTEGDEAQDPGLATRLQRNTDEVAALRLALAECWTLCNTLAGLSHIHRERGFRQIRKADGREQAWKSSWILCQRLYDTWDEDQASQVGPTLNLCREFCQSLFDVRQRENEVADSVLRVSFELNNHLYNTHDRALPEAFRERTLDFYITLCHRLMKQRNTMGDETDSLLRACWSLAEMLFSLRQNKKDEKSADEELLGSAVQACWELCDLFREGVRSVRPDRGTPRPSQATFTQAFQQARQTEAMTVSLEESEYDDDIGRQNPETPTTLFSEDTAQSPDEGQVPNIVVLGPEAKDRFVQWSSSSSLSGYSSAEDNTTSSTSTINPPSEDPRLTCLRLLIVRASTNLGHHDGNLASFVKSLPSNSFGSAAWQMKLLENYKRLVASDPSFRQAGPLRRASADNVAKSVQWMVGTGQYMWLEDLFRWVFGFHVSEAQERRGLVIQS